MADLNHYEHYKGVGTSVTTTSTLPSQTVKDSVKSKPKWQKDVMDALESIGVSQLGENVKFRDLYKMVEGRLAYSDYGLDMPTLDRIRQLGDGVGIPTFVKHYDFIGIIGRQLIGEWQEQKDRFKIDCTDITSNNEFLRERKRKYQEYALDTFKKELEIALLQQGVDVNKQDFKSQEEQQQYLEFLEQEKAKIISPAEIEKQMKDWRTVAANWAEHVVENDQQRFFMDKLDADEMKDYFLTGRFFRNYYIGYDNYKPERWSPLETFFSQDVTAEYPQDGEYVGRIFYISPSDIVKRYGHLLTPSQIIKLNENFAATGSTNQQNPVNTWKGMMDNGFLGQVQTLPFYNWYDYDMGLQIQDALDIPMGEMIVDSEHGQQRIPSWLSPFQNQNHLGYRYSDYRRDDINVRKDLLQVTEAYWRSWKRMWFLNFTTEQGYPDTAFVTDDLLPEFIEENNIQKISTKSLRDFQNDLEENSMYEIWIPEVWKGTKINAGNSLLKEDIYLGVEPLPYQIRGESNLYDVKLPVAGVISNSPAQRMRPYQVTYNICWNQIYNILEKEIGMFFLFDINFLPSEYKDYGTIEESLEKLRDHAKDIGLVPLDTTKQNMAGANANMNTFMVQDVSMDKQIKSRIELAETNYRKALEQIGFTGQRLGQPTIYETATGVKQGQEASYMQTADIFTDMSVARRKAMELHLSVAQYCQKEYLDVDFIFTNSDGDKSYINLTDPDFPLRRLGLFPINDPKKRRELEQLKQTLLNTNTLGNDMLDYANLFSADTMTELIHIGRQGRIEKQKEVEAQRKHEQEMLDKQLQTQANEKEADRAQEDKLNQRDNETRIYQAELTAQGRLGDNDSNMAYLEHVSQSAQQDIDNLNKGKELQLKEEAAKSKTSIEQEKLAKMDEDLKLKTRALDLKEKDINAKVYTSQINKN